MKIQLLLFGAVREAAGRGRLEVDLDDGATVADLRSWLAQRNAAAEKPEAADAPTKPAAGTPSPPVAQPPRAPPKKRDEPDFSNPYR